jgi:pentatricopeptide repeat protein
MLILCGRCSDNHLSDRVWSECQRQGLHEHSLIREAKFYVYALNGDAESTARLLLDINVSDISSRMLISALTAFAHAGDTKSALCLLDKIEDNHDGKVDIKAYTALIDGFARKGDFETALGLVDRIQQRGHRVDAAVWMSILSPCRHFKRLDIALRAFNEGIKLEDRPSAYVLLADVYKACGDMAKANELHDMRLKKGLFKQRGAVSLTVKDKTHLFHVGMIPSELSHAKYEIMAKLDEWAAWLAARGTDTSSILCQHSEKLALAYAVTQGMKHVVMRKNLRVCSACHEASRELTLLEGITIHHWDMNRVHIMKEGVCSCKGHY